MKKICCDLCGSEQAKIGKKELVVGKGEFSVSLDLEIVNCPDCCESFYTRRSERKINKAFADAKRKENGLLTSDEIKDFRKNIGVTQTQLSAMLNSAEKNVARYESGKSIQSATADGFLRFMIKNSDRAKAKAVEMGFVSSYGYLPNVLNDGTKISSVISKRSSKSTHLILVPQAVSNDDENSAMDDCIAQGS